MKRPILKDSLFEIAFGIVVFKEVYYETIAFLSLQGALLNFCENAKVKVYIYDNTDSTDWLVNERNFPSAGMEVIYYHNHKNPGISTAYNHMAKSAFNEGMSWMVFMDQDTSLPSNAVMHYVQAIYKNPSIFLKSPSIRVMGKQFSPASFRMMRTFLLKKELPAGIHPLRNLTIINSCMMVNLSFFNSINGYDERLRLDFTDTEFIERVKAKISHLELLPFSCSHGFSNHSTSLKATLFRFQIYVQDLLNYPTKNAWQKLQLMIMGLAHTLQLIRRFHSQEFWKIWIRKIRH